MLVGILAPSSPLREQQKVCSNPLSLGLCQPSARLQFTFRAAKSEPSNGSPDRVFSLRR